MEATLTSKGRLTLPKPARDALGLESGAIFIAADNERAGCDFAATFAADAAKVPGMKAVP